MVTHQKCRRLFGRSVQLLIVCILFSVSASAASFAPICYGGVSVRGGAGGPHAAERPAPLPKSLWGFSNAVLSRIPGTQFITMISDGSAAVIRLYERRNDIWYPVGGPMDGHVGKNGVCEEKREGDGCTPAGSFTLTEAFGLQPLPGSGLPYRQAGPDSYWVDDPASEAYNTWVEGRDGADWRSAEHLADYPEQYAYAAVIDYNRDPVVPGSGSAIFFHCGSHPTNGCVSVSEENMIRILEWLDASASPSIFIQ